MVDELTMGTPLLIELHTVYPALSAGIAQRKKILGRKQLTLGIEGRSKMAETKTSSAQKTNFTYSSPGMDVRYNVVKGKCETCHYNGCIAICAFCIHSQQVKTNRYKEKEAAE